MLLLGSFCLCFCNTHFGHRKLNISRFKGFFKEVTFIQHNWLTQNIYFDIVEVTKKRQQCMPEPLSKPKAPISTRTVRSLQTKTYFIRKVLGRCFMIIFLAIITVMWFSTLFLHYLLMVIPDQWRAVSFIPRPSDPHPFPRKKKIVITSQRILQRNIKTTAQGAQRINDSDPLPHKTTPVNPICVL